MFDTEVADLLAALNAGFPAVEEMAAAQARAAVAARSQPAPDPGIVAGTEDRVIPAPHGTLPVRLYFPHDLAGEPAPIVVFLHGGGFVFCDIDSHDGFCREMAAGTGAIVLSVGYRLAPEHRAPAAVHDAYTALCWAAENAAGFGGDPRRLAVAGDSAGGNLAAVACLVARESGGPAPAAQVLIYPVIDPACDTDSHRDYATGYFNTRAAMEWYWRQYLPERSAVVPEHHVAPLRAPSLAGLPPAVVVTAGLDPLRDEGHSYAEALARAGVSVVHRRYNGLFHGFATILPLRAAQSARTLLWQDMRALLDPTRTQEENQ